MSLTVLCSTGHISKVYLLEGLHNHLNIRLKRFASPQPLVWMRICRIETSRVMLGFHRAHGAHSLGNLPSSQNAHSYFAGAESPPSTRRIVSGWEAPPGPTRRSTFERQAYGTRLPSAGSPGAGSSVVNALRQNVSDAKDRLGEITKAMPSFMQRMRC